METHDTQAGMTDAASPIDDFPQAAESQASPEATEVPEFHDTLLGNPERQEAVRTEAEQRFALVRAQVEQDQKTQWAGMVKEWRTALEQDAELGGVYLERNVARAQLALNRFDPDGVVSTWLGASGYGNHPDVLRFLLRIANAMSEDDVLGAGGAARKATLEERMYGNWQP